MEPTPQITLSIGETHKLLSKPLETLRVQKKGILQIKDEGEQIILTAKKLGETELQLGKKKYLFKVLHKYDHKSLEQLKEWATNKRGPEITLSDGKPVIKGRLLKTSDFLDLPSFTSTSSRFQVAAKASLDLQQRIKDHFEKLLKQNNLKSGQISFTPHWLFHLPPSQKQSQELYKKIFSPYGIQVNIDEESLTSEPIVEINVYISHIKKSWMRNWGIQWPQQANISLVPGSAPQWGDFQVSLQALEEKGMGKILANPTLVTQTGKPVEFHSGGEFPIRTTTQFNNVVQWKRYGLFLKTTPQSNSQGHLAFEISIELSSLDHTQAAEGVPAIQRSEVKTQIHMEQPRPILLSGFLQQGDGNRRSGLPWLQQIPIFKPLFSNQTIYSDEYELVFILVPKFYEK